MHCSLLGITENQRFDRSPKNMDCQLPHAKIHKIYAFSPEKTIAIFSSVTRRRCWSLAQLSHAMDKLWVSITDLPITRLVSARDWESLRLCRCMCWGRTRSQTR